ncbi:hypothetical protein ERO13_D05G275900v2 [Gossypium hirsutum]|nr:hypothetical protein ERO13_D05G275900v2 [Gossypium hirsutum]
MKFISLTWIHLQQDGFISLMGYFYFLYQTFGAVDWKQARRTNSSSPLGELFDHGCDALACTFETMAFGSTAMCGRDSFWFWLVNPESGHNYRAVKRWTSQRKLGYCLLDCDKIFVPIHKDIHCCLRNTCPILSWIFPCLCRNTCPMPYFRLRTAKEILKLKADSLDVYVGFHQLLLKALLGIEMVCKDIASSDLGS